MASSYLDSTQLIASVVRRSHIPLSQNTFLAADILAFANEEMMIGLVPSIMKMHEEFYVYPVEIALVANQDHYEIPDRAIGEKIRTLFYQDSSGNLQEMTRIAPEDVPFFQASNATSYPRAYYLESDSIVLVPTIGDSPQGSLVCSIFLRPNQLVESTRVAVIESIDRTTGELLLSQVPSIFSTNVEYDVVGTNKGHKTRMLGISPTAVNGALSIITFDPSDIPTSVVVGDRLCLAGETDIPQCPDELHSVLAQRVACRCLEAQKDTEGLQNANAKLQEMEINLGMLIDNRTEGNPQKVNNTNSPLRHGKFRRRSNYF